MSYTDGTLNRKFRPALIPTTATDVSQRIVIDYQRGNRKANALNMQYLLGPPSHHRRSVRAGYVRAATAIANKLTPTELSYSSGVYISTRSRICNSMGME